MVLKHLKWPLYNHTPFVQMLLCIWHHTVIPRRPFQLHLPFAVLCFHCSRNPKQHQAPRTSKQSLGKADCSRRHWLSRRGSCSSPGLARRSLGRHASQRRPVLSGGKPRDSDAGVPSSCNTQQRWLVRRCQCPNIIRPSLLTSQGLMMIADEWRRSQADPWQASE